MDFKSKVKELVTLIESNLDKYIPAETTYPEEIYKSMRYSLFAGGKRLRPILAIVACEAVGGNVDEVLPYACAIEMIHTYTLILDDLPCMDNDDYRRGKLTNHKVFGDATAVLAASSLLNKAAETMIEDALLKKENHIKYLSAMNEILTASGSEGLIAGQIVDLSSENKQIDSETLHFIHNNKTGVFITAPIRAGAIIGGASDEQLQKLTEFSKDLGLAFQIQDDILDLIGDEVKLGKKVGSDTANNKSTFPSIYGLEKSKKMVVDLSKSAIRNLEILGEKSEFLKQIAEYLIHRES